MGCKYPVCGYFRVRKVQGICFGKLILPQSAFYSAVSESFLFLPSFKSHLCRRVLPKKILIPTICFLHVSANTQLESEQISFPETPEHSAASRRNSVPHVPAPDQIRRCDPQDDAGTPTEPPGFRFPLRVHLARPIV
ncbi:hypothetical protein BDV12DRAFT_111729 [Aspergillus spectabilis]